MTTKKNYQYIKVIYLNHIKTVKILKYVYEFKNYVQGQSFLA